MATTNLVPLIENSQHYPQTHKRGSQCFDFILGSPYLLDHITASGSTPYYEKPWPLTDHRGLFINIDTLGLFGASINTKIPLTPKKLSSLSKSMIFKFINKLDEDNILPQLLNQITQLYNTDKWENQHHIQLEEINNKFANTLLVAEAHSALPSEHPWSPEIDTASSLYLYWLIVLNGKKSRIDTKQQLDNLKQKLKNIDIFQNDPHRRPLAQMGIAPRDLINCQLESKQNVLIPNTQNDSIPPEIIQTKNVLDPVLLDQNVSHFAQAHNTPFAIQPILQLFGHNGCTQEALDALHGIIPTNISKHSQLLLQHMQRVRDPIPLNMSFDDMRHGFSKWREQTTTSPSNKHLGIYKSLLNAINTNYIQIRKQSTKLSTSATHSLLTNNNTLQWHKLLYTSNIN
jgi:hypothetical protein